MNQKYLKYLVVFITILSTQLASAQYSEKRTNSTDALRYKSYRARFMQPQENKISLKVLNFSTTNTPCDYCSDDDTGPIIDPFFSPEFEDLLRRENAIKEELKQRASQKAAKETAEKIDKLVNHALDPPAKSFEDLVDKVSNRLSQIDYIKNLSEFRQRNNISKTRVESVKKQAENNLVEYEKARVKNVMIDFRASEIESNQINNSKLGDLSLGSVKIGNITSLNELNSKKENEIQFKNAYFENITELREQDFFLNISKNDKLKGIFVMGQNKHLDNLNDISIDELTKSVVCTNCKRSSFRPGERYNSFQGEFVYGDNCYKEPVWRAPVANQPSSEGGTLNDVNCSGFSQSTSFDYGPILDKIKVEYEQAPKSRVIIPRSSISSIGSSYKRSYSDDPETNDLHLISEIELEHIAKQSDFISGSGILFDNVAYSAVSTKGLLPGEKLYKLTNGDVLFESVRKFPLKEKGSRVVNLNSRTNPKQLYLSSDGSKCKRWNFANNVASTGNIEIISKFLTAKNTFLANGGDPEFARVADEEFNRGSEVDFDDEIIYDSTFLNTSYLCAFREILNLEDNFFESILKGFSNDDEIVDLKFEVGPMPRGFSHAEAVTDDTELESKNLIKIIINKDNVTQGNRNYGVVISSTILHELIHAQIYKFVHQANNKLPVTQRNVLNIRDRKEILRLYHRFNGNVADAQHRIMADNYVNKIARALRILDGNILPQSTYLPYAWDGLLNMGTFGLEQDLEDSFPMKRETIRQNTNSKSCEN